MADVKNQDPLLQLVLEQGYISEDEVEEILNEHRETGKPIKKVLIDLDKVSEDILMEIIANHLGGRVVNLAAMDIPPDVIHAIPAGVARMYNTIPVSADTERIELAVSDIVTPEVHDELRFLLTKDVSFAVAREDDIRTFINQLYGDDSEAVSQMLSSLEEEIDEMADTLNVNEENLDEKGLEMVAGSAPVVRFVHLVLYQAVMDRASDIHFEPFEKEFKIRYRVDGALYEMAPPPRKLALPVISRIKVMGGLNIAERRLPQDGRIQIKVAGRPIDLRVSTLPTQFGESVVLRVLDRSTVSLDLEKLGMPDDIYQMLCEDINKPNGIIIVTGPTGSGKTTTLYSCLRKLNTVDVKILSAEEPVEYDIEGIVQVPVNEAVGNTFARILRAFLRQDPDIIMVGEIRDLETAQIAIQASLTGHLVFSTLHTNDAPGAVTRLIDMGIEPYLVSSTLEVVLAQRLVRTICVYCKTPYKPSDDVLTLLGLTRKDIGDKYFYSGVGCKRCNNIGYHGRKGLYEYLRVTEPIRVLINERSPTHIIRTKAIEMGMRTLREDGIRNILDGLTTVEEVLKYT